MLKRTFYRARFGYHQNCSLIHHILPGESINGMPVIIFPQEQHKILEGKLYEFLAKPTLDATYVIENGGTKTTYRVVHAITPILVNGNEAGFVDQILHRTSGDTKRPSVAERISGDALAKLQALRERL